MGVEREVPCSSDDADGTVAAVAEVTVTRCRCGPSKGGGLGTEDSMALLGSFLVAGLTGSLLVLSGTASPALSTERGNRLGMVEIFKPPPPSSPTRDSFRFFASRSDALLFLFSFFARRDSAKSSSQSFTSLARSCGRQARLAPILLLLSHHLASFTHLPCV